MNIESASKLLATMYKNAPTGKKVVAIHLFGIKYADEIRNMSTKDITIGAQLPESYKTEINKGINLADYVSVTKDI
ncbi:MULTISPECIES: hypothetical protein [Thalassospira]|uniref:HTH-like domain-containing protein n=1 Tax=Thalassospira TaxID=168934 RepID=UPI0008DDDBAB|nr:MULTISPECIES: hypothetical protein [Thalassospira]MDM7976274.1 hypothetical protein [Thalassospira xiamenensis]OHY97735.1 hypothetical protein BC440_10630 [Thalassospira sp. MIT1004]